MRSVVQSSHWAVLTHRLSFFCGNQQLTEHSTAAFLLIFGMYDVAGTWFLRATICHDQRVVSVIKTFAGQLSCKRSNACFSSAGAREYE